MRVAVKYGFMALGFRYLMRILSLILHAGRLLTMAVYDKYEDLPPGPMQHGWTNCVQDYHENAAFQCVGGLEARAEGLKAPEWVLPENAALWLQGYEAAALKLFGPEWRTVSFGWVPAIRLESAIEGEEVPPPE